MKKHLIIIMSLLFIVMVLSGCGDKAVRESQIQTDIEQSESYAMLNIKTTDFNIIKRQTNTDQKEDIIYVMIGGQNEDYTAIQSYEVLYRLYNDGWRLESISAYYGSDAFNQITPLHGVSEDDVITFLYAMDMDLQDIISFDESSVIGVEFNDSPIKIESNLNDESANSFYETFYFELVYQYNIFNERVIMPVEYVFYNHYGNVGWYPLPFNEMMLMRIMELNEGIKGVWEYHDTVGLRDIHAYVEISDFSVDGCTVIGADYYDYNKNESFHTSGHMALNYEIGSSGKINTYGVKLEWDDSKDRNQQNCGNFSYPFEIKLNRSRDTYATGYGWKDYCLEMNYMSQLYK